ncbi:MAG: hypothetical protein IJK46_04350 [Prevotella sp.]|nr:hypothetical protein [Prevotella sp.]
MDKIIYARPLITVTESSPFLLAGSGMPPGYIPDPQVGGAKEQDFFEPDDDKPVLNIDVRKLYSNWDEDDK